jgi:hypothetical protein
MSACGGHSVIVAALADGGEVPTSDMDEEWTTGVLSYGLRTAAQGELPRDLVQSIETNGHAFRDMD